MNKINIFDYLAGAGVLQGTWDDPESVGSGDFDDYLPLAGGTMSGDFDAGANNVKNVNQLWINTNGSIRFNTSDIIIRYTNSDLLTISGGSLAFDPITRGIEGSWAWDGDDKTWVLEDGAKTIRIKNADADALKIITAGPLNWIDCDTSGEILTFGNSTDNQTYVFDGSGLATFHGSIRVGDAYTLPAAKGDNGQILKTDGEGVVTWEDESAGDAPDDTAYNEGIWNANSDAATKNAIRDEIEAIYAAIPTVDDTAYNEGTWNTNSDAASKNAIRDEIEAIYAAIPTVDDTPYISTSWNGNSDAATKNALRDEIEAIYAEIISATVAAPALEAGVEEIMGIHPCNITMNDNSTDNWVRNSAYLDCSSGVVYGYFPIIVPNGSSITAFKVYADDNGYSGDVQLIRTLTNTDTSHSHFVMADYNTEYDTLYDADPYPGLPLAVNNEAYNYSLQIKLQDGAYPTRLYGGYVKYTLPTP